MFDRSRSRWRGRRRVSAVLVLAIPIALSAFAAVPANGAATSPLGPLPSGASFRPIAKATSSELVIFSSLVSVTRWTWGPRGNLGAFCFDLTTGGPEIVLVERGTLRYSVFPAADIAGDLPRYVDADGGAPPKAAVPVLPNTDLDLGPGDLAASPNGAQCGKHGTAGDVTFLDVFGLPSGVPVSSIPDLSMIAEPLDVAPGVATAQGAAPPSVLVGRVSIKPGKSLPLEALRVPLIFAVQAGEATISTDMQAAVVRRAGTEPQQESEPLPVDTDVPLGTGDASYVLPATTGKLTNVGDHVLRLYAVAILPGIADEATPTP
jgi:hypothetical protein